MLKSIICSTLIGDCRKYVGDPCLGEEGA